MEDSILKSTKKVLSIPDGYNAFDLDVTTHINATFSVLSQLGVGPEEGYAIEDDEPVWQDLALPLNLLSLVRSYMYLKVRMLFDPPTTSFLLESYKEQIAEFEARISMFREDALPPTIPPPSTSEEVVFVPLPSYMEGGYGCQM